MSPLAGSLRPLPRTTLRTFRSPLAALSAPSRMTTTPSATAAPVYEKQDDSSPEPLLSSSGTRTYVVSEPDPSDTPYQVPSGAYPNSASYVGPAPTPNPVAPHGSTDPSVIHPYNTHTVGESAAVRNTEVPGEISRRAASRGGIGFMHPASTKQGKF